MAHSKLYRSFIILQEDERGHSLSDDKPLSGYAKVEVKNDKCKVAFYAQNLKKDYEKCNMMLICGKKETESLLNLGTMNITPQGKAECSIEFDANNIGNTGVSYDKIVGASLCKPGGGKFKYMMCGFLNGEKPTSNWKDYKKIDCINQEQKSSIKNIGEPGPVVSKPVSIKKVEEPGPVASKSVNPKNMEDPGPVASKSVNPKNMEEPGPVASKSTSTNNMQDPGPVINNTDGNCSCSRSVGGFRNKYEEYEELIDNSSEEGQIGKYTYEDNEDDFELRGNVGDFFESIVDSLEQTRCSKEIKKCKWYKVPVKNFDTMCNIADYNKYTTLYYPMTNYYPYIANSGHFVVGLKCDTYGTVKYLVYGIKGKKGKNNQPYDGKTGFVTWAPSMDGETDMGYWLMFYDFKNHVVVVPSK